MSHTTRTRTVLAGVTALTGALVGLPLLAAPAEASSTTTCYPIREHRQAGRFMDDNLLVKGDLFVRRCRTPRPGKDLTWDKPYAGWGTYDAQHMFWSNRYNCLGQGTGLMQSADFHYHVWNNANGYNATQTLHVDCDDDGHNSDAVGLTHEPRCYTVAGPCKFKITVDIRKLIAQDEHYTVGSGYIAP
jgi:hypothetical protein